MPVRPPTFNAKEYIRAESNDLQLAIKPIDDVGEYWKLFDDDLPSIGIAAVWVVLKNVGAREIDLTNARWVANADGRQFRSMNYSQVLDRYYKARKIRMYTVNADLKARQSLERIMVESRRLRPSTETDGFIFFRIEETPARDWTRKAILRISGIRGDNGKRFNLTVPLGYATP